LAAGLESEEESEESANSGGKSRYAAGQAFESRVRLESQLCARKPFLLFVIFIPIVLLTVIVFLILLFNVIVLVLIQLIVSAGPGQDKWQ
jgi:hypothetical protein